MQVQQYYLGCLSHVSYVITDEKTKTAAVVDPQRDIEQYLRDAPKAAEPSGTSSSRISMRTSSQAISNCGTGPGRQSILGAAAKQSIRLTHVKDGDLIEFGDVRLQILETPGHTPEGISILVFDPRKAWTQPYAVMTGDTLFIGDVGRPDLLASIGVTADELAEMLYDSLRQKLLTLPDATLVYPAHGAGSMCGKNLSTETVSTIGEQKKFNVHTHRKVLPFHV